MRGCTGLDQFGGLYVGPGCSSRWCECGYAVVGLVLASILLTYVGLEPHLSSLRESRTNRLCKREEGRVLVSYILRWALVPRPNRGKRAKGSSCHARTLLRHFRQEEWSNTLSRCPISFGYMMMGGMVSCSEHEVLITEGAYAGGVYLRLFVSLPDRLHCPKITNPTTCFSRCELSSHLVMAD